MTRTVTPHLIIARGDQRNDASRIAELFADRHGPTAAGNLFDASLNEHGDTVIIALSQELRELVIRQSGWTEWYPGEAYPLRSDPDEVA